MKKQILVLLSVFILLPFLSYPGFQNAGAISLEEQIKIENKKLENYKKIYQEAEEKEKEQDYKIAGLSFELAGIEKNLIKLGRDNQMLQQELNLADAEYRLVTNELETLTLSIEEKEKKMDKILFILYKNYTLDYSAYLFSSKSLNEILDKTIYLQYLYQAHKSYFQSYASEIIRKEKKQQDIVGAQVKFYDKKDQVEKSMNEYASLEKKKNQQINNESQTKEMLKQQQEEAEREMSRTNSRIKELIKKKIEEDRKKKYGTTPFGKIQWPIAGKVTSLFGNRLHPIFGDYRMHTGIDIDADSGTPIHACAKGTVIYAGWLSGYGNVVIIQHNNTHSSVYAHQRAYFVREEQAVELGEVIGEVGSTGWSTGPHLHFEIRINGEPVNPMNYLPH